MKLTLYFLLFFVPLINYGQTIKRINNETSEQLANRLKPKESSLVHSVIETNIWNTPTKCILAFYQIPSHNEAPDDIEGYLFYSIDSATYKIIKFGPIEGDAGSPANIIAVFFTNADKDSEKEIIVLSEIRFSNYDVYGKLYQTNIFDNPKSSLTKLLYLKELSGKFDDCDCIGTDRPDSDQKGRNDKAKYKTAKAIKDELKRLGY